MFAWCLYFVCRLLLAFSPKRHPIVKLVYPTICLLMDTYILQENRARYLRSIHAVLSVARGLRTVCTFLQWARDLKEADRVFRCTCHNTEF